MQNTGTAGLKWKHTLQCIRRNRYTKWWHCSPELKANIAMQRLGLHSVYSIFGMCFSFLLAVRCIFMLLRYICKMLQWFFSTLLGSKHANHQGAPRTVTSSLLHKIWVQQKPRRRSWNAQCVPDKHPPDNWKFWYWRMPSLRNGVGFSSVCYHCAYGTTWSISIRCRQFSRPRFPDTINSLHTESSLTAEKKNRTATPSGDRESGDRRARPCDACKESTSPCTLFLQTILISSPNEHEWGWGLEPTSQ